MYAQAIVYESSGLGGGALAAVLHYDQYATTSNANTPIAPSGGAYYGVSTRIEYVGCGRAQSTFDPTSGGWATMEAWAPGQYNGECP